MTEDLDKRILGNTLAGPFFETDEGKGLLDNIKKAAKDRAEAAVELKLLEQKRDIVVLREQVAKLEPENERLSAELRTINRNAAEERIARLVRERVDAATVVLQNDLAAARREVAELTSKNQELTVAKKRLREALDRLKEK
jgi:hypothetical protein